MNGKREGGSRGLTRRDFLKAGAAGVAVAGLPRLSWAQGGGEIPVVFASELSGPISFLGKSATEAARLAEEQINARGGIHGRKLKLLVGDTGGNPATAVNFVRQSLLRDGAVAVSGIILSNVSLAVKPLLEQRKVPGVMVQAGTNKLIDARTHYNFRITGSDYQFNVGTARFFKAMGSKRVALLVEDTSYGRDSLHDFTAEARKEDVEVVAQKINPQGETNFVPVLNEIKPLNPDAVYLVHPGASSVFATKQMHEVGLKPRITLGVYSDSLPFFANALKDLVVGQYAWTMPGRGRAVEALDRAYQARYHHAPNVFSAFGYDAVQIIAQAIRRANSLNPQAIRNEIARTNYDSALGFRVRFTPNGANEGWKLYVGKWAKKGHGYAIEEVWHSGIIAPRI